MRASRTAADAKCSSSVPAAKSFCAPARRRSFPKMLERSRGFAFCSTKRERFVKLWKIPEAQMSGRVRRQHHLAILITLLLWVSTMPARAVTISVTNTNDDGPGSLRQALTTANNGDTIDFAVTG